jgi:Carboxypeptidase regulatory-like domain
MAPPLVSVRCPACGGPLAVVPAPTPPTQWFSCPHCLAPVPVVVPRDPPPLYTWEVLPGLYPYLPTPRVPKWRARRTAFGALLNVTVIALVLVAILGYYAAAAPTPAQYSVSGTVGLAQNSSSPIFPAVGALVIATDESGHNTTAVTADDGSFRFASLPTGGVSLNMSYPGYAPVTVDIFLSTVFSAGSTAVSVTLFAGNLSNGTLGSLTPFINLEAFVAAIGSGIVLLALVAAIAGAAALLTLRSDRPALGVVGGGAGLFAPLVIVTLDLSTPFPILLAASGLLAAFGGFALAIRAIEMGLVGAAPD